MFVRPEFYALLRQCRTNPNVSAIVARHSADEGSGTAVVLPEMEPTTAPPETNEICGAARLPPTVETWPPTLNKMTRTIHGSRERSHLMGANVEAAYDYFRKHGQRTEDESGESVQESAGT